TRGRGLAPGGPGPSARGHLGGAGRPTRPPPHLRRRASAHGPADQGGGGAGSGRPPRGAQHHETAQRAVGPGGREPHGRPAQAGLQEALEDLRNLARGIYPPLLADKGLEAALRSQVRNVPLPVRVEADGVVRYAQEQEAAVYFCALEALQNVAKYAHASEAVV